ncbi:MAG: UDP-Glc:alpha-D-GlcNAc-diphosphoundecaprenol beta-1,3-glucosyltransferase WfgD [Gammaproteobacteria bacterium]|nr:UDP-Glc:alpha-D-GlcNAc-diphosphoundecaprenol beta-1,3-glucosyltransferase WfgD [Gammaproteobacteria bacterium]
MRVAVVVPAHNRYPVLGRALDSVFHQSSPVDQCIVVDDGSTDETEVLVRRSYPKVTYLKQQHQGVSAARNLGIERARADWVAFLDSDDYWLPCKLESQRQALAGTDYAICHTDENWIRRGRRVHPMRKHQKRGGWIYQYCLPLCAISPSTSMVRRDVLVAAGGFDETLPVCEDYDLWLRLCARYPVLYINRPLVTRYGGHNDQLSAQYWGMDRFRIAALEKMLDVPELSPKDRHGTLETLVAKLNILVGGARKRGNDFVIDTYQDRLMRYEELLFQEGAT